MSRAELERLADAIAVRERVPPGLVRAVIRWESNWEPRAYRAEPQISDGSYGLMQVLQGTARGLGFTGSADALYNPVLNITLGAQLLRRNYNRAGAVPTRSDTERWRVALAAYNAGWSKVRRNDAPRKPDGSLVNEEYVKRILGEWKSRGAVALGVVLALAGLGWLAVRAGQ